MDRLTERGITYNFSKLDVSEIRWLERVQKRLAAYEDTGLTPEEIRKTQEALKPIEFSRFREILEAEREGRLVILPCRENAELKMNGNTYRGDHWNHTLTAFRDDPTTRSGKQVTLFSIEAAEKALEEANG